MNLHLPHPHPHRPTDRFIGEAIVYVIALAVLLLTALAWAGGAR